MKDVIILTGISLLRKESAENRATWALKLKIDSKTLAIGYYTFPMVVMNSMYG